MSRLTPRQFKTFEGRVSRIDMPFARIAIPVVKVFVAVATIVLLAIQTRPMYEIDPRHLDVAAVAVVTVARIEVEHRSPRR